MGTHYWGDCLKIPLSFSQGHPGWVAHGGRFGKTAPQALDFHYFTRHTQQRDVSLNDVSFATFLVYPNNISQVLGGKFQNN